MSGRSNHKKKSIISYKNLSDDLKELFKETYPDGHENFIQRTLKPDGTPIFIVPLEAEDTSYMVKFDVKIDTHLVEEDPDKGLYGDDGDGKDDGDYTSLDEAMDREEGRGHFDTTLRHGAYEEIEGLPEDKKEFEDLDDGLDEAYSDDIDLDEEEEEPEPSADDIADLEENWEELELPKVEEKPKRGRPTKAMMEERKRQESLAAQATGKKKFAGKVMKDAKPKRKTSKKSE